MRVLVARDECAGRFAGRVSAPDVTVVVVSHNVRDLVLACLASVPAGADGLAVEAFLVDNASSDGTVEAVRAAHPGVTVTANTANAGFPAANNQALRTARGRYCFLLNPDAELRPGALRTLAAALAARPEVWVAGPRLLNTDGTLQSSAYREPTLGRILAEMLYLPGGRALPAAAHARAFDAEVLSGAALLVRREVFDRVGLLDERLFWIEDVDLCVRVRRAGGRVAYVPAAEVVHHQGRSAQTNWDVTIANQATNQVRFYRLHRSSAAAAVVLALCLANALVRAAVFTLLAPLRTDWRAKARAYRRALPAIVRGWRIREAPA